MRRNKPVMIAYKATGNGQSECTRCRNNGKWSLTWTEFLYKIFNEEENGIYCYDCIIAIAKERNADAYIVNKIIRHVR